MVGKPPPEPSEKRLLLEKISWQKFETVLVEMGSTREARFTYDRGKLELLTPLGEHERCKKLIESLLLVLANVMGLPTEVVQSPLLQCPDVGRATEPDLCYYTSPPLTPPAVIDLPSDHPPTLVLEVSLLPALINRMPIYADFGIPEVWRYVSDGGRKLLIYQLEERGYRECDRSPTFPGMSNTTVTNFIEQSNTLGLQMALHVLREELRRSL